MADNDYPTTPDKCEHPEDQLDRVSDPTNRADGLDFWITRIICRRCGTVVDTIVQ